MVEFWVMEPKANRERWHRLWCVCKHSRHTRRKLYWRAVFGCGGELTCVLVIGHEERQRNQPYLHRPHGWDRSPVHSLAGSVLDGEPGGGCRLYSEKLQVLSSWHRRHDKLRRKEKYSRLQVPQRQSPADLPPWCHTTPKRKHVGRWLHRQNCPLPSTLILHPYPTCYQCPLFALSALYAMALFSPMTTFGSSYW